MQSLLATFVLLLASSVAIAQQASPNSPRLVPAIEQWLLPALQGCAVDTAAGEVEMHVRAPGGGTQCVAARSGAIERLIDDPVRITAVAGRVSLQDG